jgi:hypothetical protein
VLTIIDPGQNPEAKALLLSGRLNVAICPHCGHAGVLSSPVVYHDANNELLLTFAAPELGLSDTEQQQVIGDLTNRVISALPAEQRKGYLLRPRSFLRLDAMIEAILEADGITPEMLARQRARASLLERLLVATSDDARRVIAQENDEEIDYEFFSLLTLNLEMADAEGQAQVAQQLRRLREQLLEWTVLGQEIVASEQAIKELGDEITREGLLDKLVQAALAGEQTKVEAMIAFARPAIDYIFYQQLTARIEEAEESGNTDEAATLRTLRETTLDLTAQIDAQRQKGAEQSAELLQQIMDSDELEEAIRANLDRINELFLSVLATRLEAAVKSGHSEDAERLRQISDTLMSLIQESQPPQVQLINQLLSTDYPEGTKALLEENTQFVNDGLLEFMQVLEDDLAQNSRHELARKLGQIREQAAELAR